MGFLRSANGKVSLEGPNASMEKGVREVAKDARWAFLSAFCGFLIFPAVVALVKSVQIIRWAVNTRRYGWIVSALVIIIVAAGTASFSLSMGWAWLRVRMYEFQLGAHASYLSAAIYKYHETQGRLPESLDELRETGLYGPIAYEHPGREGVSPLYLPIHEWDGTTPVVVAVTAKCSPVSGARRRAFVILGDWLVHYATDDDLRWILAADDRIREALGEQRRWGDLPWQQP